MRCCAGWRRSCRRGPRQRPCVPLWRREVALILSDANLDTAVAVSERLRLAMAAAFWRSANGGPAVTVTFGLTLCDTPIPRVADRALYDAKGQRTEPAGGRDGLRRGEPPHSKERPGGDVRHADRSIGQGRRQRRHPYIDVNPPITLGRYGSSGARSKPERRMRLANLKLSSTTAFARGGFGRMCRALWRDASCAGVADVVSQVAWRGSRRIGCRHLPLAMLLEPNLGASC